MDDIIEWFKRIINILKGAIYVAATIIAALPFIEIDTKIYWIVILGLILFIIAPIEADKFIIKRVRNIIYSYVVWVLIVTLITEVLIPTLQSL
jgi:hypothetical protein